LSRKAYFGCLSTTALAAASVRWLCDLIAPWSVGDDLNLLYSLCCLAATPVIVCAAVICFIISVVKTSSDWRKISSHCLGLILVGAFIYSSLPLIGALLTPTQPPEARGPLDHDCTWIRESTLEYSSGHPSRYAETTNTWLDIDGDGDQERWEQIDAKSGGIGFTCAVFIYEVDESTPRWCGKVAAGYLFMAAWVRPINLDLDLAPEIWMRDAIFLPQTYSFLDFSANEVREIDPRLMILFILIPVRVLPLLVWFPFRHRPLHSITILIVMLSLPIF
jgi:hypothetical protein